MRALKATLAVLVVILGLALGALLGGYYWYRQHHVKINGTVYSLEVRDVDLRGTRISEEEYAQIRKTLPQAAVHWDVPFQGSYYPDDTRELTVETLSQEDLKQLAYFPGLAHLAAPECRDYENLLQLETDRPQCSVDFFVHLGNQKLDRGAQSLTLARDEASGQELAAAMAFLPQLQEVTLEDPSIPAEELYALQEQYPDTAISWNKKFMGKVYEMDLKELDLSGQEPGPLDRLEAELSYFPNLKKLILVDCGYENEELAAFRDRVRDHYKVVWAVKIGRYKMRTDTTAYMPSTTHIQIHDEDTYNLRYCEDLIAVDFGHINVGETSWVVGTPHLKYLILGDGNVFNKHMKPLSCLKELEFLEIFKAPVTDITPLVQCTGLRDLLLSGCYIDPEPLGQMTWLENLWLLDSGISYSEAQYLHEKLPGTHIESAGDRHSHARGWRDLPRYFEMRDAFGMGYMKG